MLVNIPYMEEKGQGDVILPKRKYWFVVFRHLPLWFSYTVNGSWWWLMMINKNLVGGLVYLPLWKIMEWVTDGMMKFPIWWESHIKFHGSKPPSSIQWIGFVFFYRKAPYVSREHRTLISGNPVFLPIHWGRRPDFRNQGPWGELRDLPSGRQTMGISWDNGDLMVI